jgi:hypothetical protein
MILQATLFERACVTMFGRWVLNEHGKRIGKLWCGRVFTYRAVRS